MTIALSHSRLSDYQQCPLRFKLKYLDKAFPSEDDSPHLIRGSNVHKQLENYIVKKIAEEVNIPPSSLPEVENTKPIIDSLFTSFEQVLPEAQLAVNSKWEFVDWFSKQAYYRCIIDVIALGPKTAWIGDFKTGKIYPYSGFGGQIHLSSAMVLSIYPHLEEISNAYLYVDHRKSHPIKFVRSELPALTAHFDEQSRIVNADKEFKPTPNDNCKWCPATRSQCKYSRKMPKVN